MRVLDCYRVALCEVWAGRRHRSPSAVGADYSVRGDSGSRGSGHRAGAERTRLGGRDMVLLGRVRNSIWFLFGYYRQRRPRRRMEVAWFDRSQAVWSALLVSLLPIGLSAYFLRDWFKRQGVKGASHGGSPAGGRMATIWSSAGSFGRVVADIGDAGLAAADAGWRSACEDDNSG